MSAVNLFGNDFYFTQADFTLFIICVAALAALAVVLTVWLILLIRSGVHSKKAPATAVPAATAEVSDDIRQIGRSSDKKLVIIVKKKK